MPKQDAVLCVGAGPLQLALLLEAQALGLWVIATDGNPAAPGLALADEAHVLDTYDLQCHRTLAETLATRLEPRLCGVVTAGADVAATVAVAAQAAGVRGIPPQVARRLQDKAMVRALLDDAGLQRYQPCFAMETYQDGLRYAIADIDEILGGYPVVVKPLTQRASRGVTIVHEERSLAAAVALALTYGDEYLIEQCLEGSEHSIEGILTGKAHGDHWFNIVDRCFSYHGGHAIETGHINPTSLPVDQQVACHKMWLEAAHTLGVTWGAFKIDAMLTADGPKILECTARLSGGYDCQGTSPLTGRHPLRTLLQVSCSLPVEPPPPARGYAACAAILPHATGRLQALPPSQDWLSNAPAQVLWHVQPGDAIQPLLHNAQRAGFCLAHAETYAEAWSRASSAAAALATAMEIV